MDEKLTPPTSGHHRRFSRKDDSVNIDETIRMETKNDFSGLDFEHDLLNQLGDGGETQITEAVKIYEFPLKVMNFY